MLKSITILIFLVANFTSFAADRSKQWQYIDSDWGYGEVDQGICDTESFRVHASGNYRLNSCGTIKVGKATHTQMKELDVVMKRVMMRINKRIVCDDRELMDYDWDIRVKSPDLPSKKVFFINDNFNTCARGSNPIIDGVSFYESLDGALHEIAHPESR